jgi:hypothetical protein
VPDLLSPLRPSPAPAPAAPLPPSPPAARLRRKRWADPRLGLGAALVVTSVVAGARVVAAADDSHAVWAVTRNLAAGSTLTAADLSIRQVRLDGAVNPYVAGTGPAPVGTVLRHDLAAGELVPAAALGSTAPAAERLVTVPVGRDRLPLGLEPGQRVDVYAAADDGAEQERRQVLAVSGARVDRVEDAGRYGAGQGRVVLAVPVPKVAGLVASLAAGPVDLVVLP